MKDKGLVVSTKEEFATVEVSCFVESCHKCSAQSLCVGQSQSKGLLSVRNPLKACSGDEVEIDIPETKYTNALILLFGSFLLAALLGMGTGYLLSFISSFSPEVTSLFGLLFALIVAGIGLSRYFKRRNIAQLYPVITNITKKGECHG